MTSQMEDLQVRDIIERVISDLKQVGVDGETMQHILEEVGMEDQMLRQLVMTQPIEEVEFMYEERKGFEQFKTALDNVEVKEQESTLEEVFHSILEEVEQGYYDWGVEAQMEEAKRLFKERGHGDYDEMSKTF